MVKNAGIVLIDEEALLIHLGYSGGTIRHISWAEDQDLIGVVVQHSNMPRTETGDQLVVMKHITTQISIRER